MYVFWMLEFSGHHICLKEDGQPMYIFFLDVKNAFLAGEPVFAIPIPHVSRAIPWEHLRHRHRVEYWSNNKSVRVN